MAEHVTSEESELYALGVLDGEEKTAFETHLRSCDDCTRGVASAHQRVALIGLACVPETPRPAVREKIMRRIMAERAGSWTQEKTAQISELRVDIEPEPEPEPKSKGRAKQEALAEAEVKPKSKAKHEIVAVLEPEPEEDTALVGEGSGRRVQWVAAGLAVLLLAGTSAGWWVMHRSHQKQPAPVQQQAEASQPSQANTPAVAAPSALNEKPAAGQKDKARTDANHLAAGTATAETQEPDSTPAAQPEVLTDTAPSRISASQNSGDAPPSLAIGADLDSSRGAGMPALPGATTGPRVEQAPSGPMRVSSGVAAARLLAPIQPAYPDIARESHIQGTVVVEATITTTGRVRYVHVVSGPALLTGAALAAVQRARYRPFMLNGTAVEAQTTITLVFKLE
ncbi:MAG TPA: TonB family protein [Acidobacteriaceae bacterium]|nr:TonB family protein [Acidobacteriaceae bacterium]